MIAKAEWFNRRKYTGWGLIPKNKQGVLYVLAIALIFIFITNLPISNMLKMIFSGSWTVFVSIDILLAMMSLKLDEREQKIEAIAERNASWMMVTSMVFVMFFVTFYGKELKGVELVPVLIFPMIIGVITKGLSNFILERQEL